jgi:hypothetical protein
MKEEKEQYGMKRKRKRDKKKEREQEKMKTNKITTTKESIESYQVTSTNDRCSISNRKNKMGEEKGLKNKSKNITVITNIHLIAHI